MRQWYHCIRYSLFLVSLMKWRVGTQLSKHVRVSDNLSPSRLFLIPSFKIVVLFILTLIDTFYFPNHVCACMSHALGRFSEYRSVQSVQLVNTQSYISPQELYCHDEWNSSMDSGKSLAFLMRIPCHFNDSMSQLLAPASHSCSPRKQKDAWLHRKQLLIVYKYLHTNFDLYYRHFVTESKWTCNLTPSINTRALLQKH